MVEQSHTCAYIPVLCGSLIITCLDVGCRQQKHPFERVATPYQVHSWMAPALDHNIDYIRAEDGRFCNSNVAIAINKCFFVGSGSSTEGSQCFEPVGWATGRASGL